jgi:DNA replication protein DnaC
LPSARAEEGATTSRRSSSWTRSAYTPIGREECNLFFRFIANRYEKASTIITSSKAFSDWTELFHDPIIVTAFLDRLLHHSVVINMRGNSYRLRGKVGKEGEEMGQS